MPIDNWKRVMPGDDQWPHLDITEGDEDDENEDAQGPQKHKTIMKNIFVDTKIKKQKFTKEIVDKIKFAPIKDLMNICDAQEAYLGAYSEAEFYAYRFQHLYKFYPDLLRIRHIQPEKFLKQLFKFADISDDVWYKSFDDARGDITINVVMFCIETGRDDKMYLFVDSDEAMFFYNKEDEKDEDSPLHILAGLIKGCVEPVVSKNKIYVVYQSQSGFAKTGFSVKKINVDLEQNYNDGFIEVSEEIVKGLNDKNKTNLVILRGAPGTGKCVIGKTKIHIRNKKTGKVEEIYIEDLM
jgi:hypothetical protein